MGHLDCLKHLGALVTYTQTKNADNIMRLDALRIEDQTHGERISNIGG